MVVFVTGGLSRFVAGEARIQRDVIAGGVTADSTIWTADSHCWTADGRIVCIAADVVEPAAALDALDALVIAGGAVIPADVAEAAEALDQPDAVSSVSTDALEPATALDALDAVADVAADVVEATDAIDQLDADAVPAGAILADALEPATALDALDATVEAAEIPVAGGGTYYPPQQRPFPVIGHGYGILPQLRGEARGVVVVAGAGVGTLPGIVGEATGSAGVAGRSAAQLFVRAMATGAGGTRGSGEGVIVKFSGSATGRHDDDAAAVIAFLLAA